MTFSVAVPDSATLVDSEGLTTPTSSMLPAATYVGVAKVAFSTNELVVPEDVVYPQVLAPDSTRCLFSSSSNSLAGEVWSAGDRFPSPEIITTLSMQSSCVVVLHKLRAATIGIFASTFSLTGSAADEITGNWRKKSAKATNALKATLFI